MGSFDTMVRMFAWTWHLTPFSASLVAPSHFDIFDMLTPKFIRFVAVVGASRKKKCIDSVLLVYFQWHQNKRHNPRRMNGLALNATAIGDRSLACSLALAWRHQTRYDTSLVVLHTRDTICIAPSPSPVQSSPTKPNNINFVEKVLIDWHLDRFHITNFSSQRIAILLPSEVPIIIYSPPLFPKYLHVS